MDLQTALEAMSEVPCPYGFGVCVSTIDGEHFYVQITHEDVWDYSCDDGGGSEFESLDDYKEWVESKE